jgi:hypothetical protein
MQIFRAGCTKARLIRYTIVWESNQKVEARKMLYELTLVTTYFNQFCINRWNYRLTGTPAAVSGSFALAFATGLLQTEVDGGFPFGSFANNIRTNLNEAVRFIEVTSRAIYSNTDFYASPISPVKSGSVVGEGLPPFCAYGFKTNRVRTDIRRATKRFVGVTESDVSGGGVIVAGRLNALTALANAMTQPLTYIDEGQTLTFTPCVLRKQRYTTEAGTIAYRYYPTLTEQLNFTAESVIWQPYPTVRSQGSRQYGRGV